MGHRPDDDLMEAVRSQACDPVADVLPRADEIGLDEMLISVLLTHERPEERQLFRDDFTTVLMSLSQQHHAPENQAVTLLERTA